MSGIGYTQAMAILMGKMKLQIMIFAALMGTFGLFLE
jgi:hypothetical protein